MDGGSSAIKLKKEKCGGQGCLAAYIHLCMSVYVFCVCPSVHMSLCVCVNLCGTREEVVGVWQTKSPLCGYSNSVHGGPQVGLC